MLKEAILPGEHAAPGRQRYDIGHSILRDRDPSEPRMNVNACIRAAAFGIVCLSVGFAFGRRSPIPADHYAAPAANVIDPACLH